MQTLKTFFLDNFSLVVSLTVLFVLAVIRIVEHWKYRNQREKSEAEYADFVNEMVRLSQELKNKQQNDKDA